MAVIGHNFVMTMYLAHYKPKMYRIELMNEVFMSAASLHLLLFSEWVPIIYQEFYGWTFVGFVGLFIITNLFFVIKNGLNVHFVLLKFKARFCKKKRATPTVVPT